MYKLIAVCVFGMMEMITLTWLRSRYIINPIIENDPVYNRALFVRSAQK